MQKSVLLMAIVATLVFTLSVPVGAEPMSQALGRCAAKPACGYSTLGNGDVVGCSVKSKGGTGKCFYCNNDTKDCFQVRRAPEAGKWQRVWFMPGRPTRL
jgi:hypothetical protein